MKDFTKFIQSKKVIIINAIVTFFETALAVLMVSKWDFTNKTVVAGAIGAGASAVWNTIVKPYLKANTILYK